MRNLAHCLACGAIGFAVLLAAAGCQTGSPPPPARAAATETRLRVPGLVATIDAGRGRLTSLVGPGGFNPVWFSPAPAVSGPGWHNHGGDIFWPVRQERWPDLFGAAWPPAAIIDPIPWQGTRDSSAYLLTHDYPAPLAAHATRRFRLEAGSPRRLVIDQAFERRAVSAAPLTFWNILRVHWPAEVWVPAAAPAATMGAVPPPAIWTRYPGCWAMDFRRLDDSMVKLRFPTPTPWIAARWGNHLLLLRHDGSPADGGLTELWWSRAAGCVELELVSPEHDLAPAAHARNRLVIEWHRLHDRQRSGVLAGYLRAHTDRRSTP